MDRKKEMERMGKDRMGPNDRTMITKMNKAMIILYKEQQRRSKLPIRSNTYINEIKFMRKFMRRLYRKLSATKIKAGKYPVLLSNEQWEEIKSFYEIRYNTSQPRCMAAMLYENFMNLEKQIKIAKGEY